MINHVQPALSIDDNGVEFTERNAPPINPALDSTRTFAPIGDSWYNALQLQIQKRFSQGFTFSTSYTWSKNLGNVGAGVTGGEWRGGGGFRVSNAWDFKGFDKGRLDQDVPHNFNFNFTYEIPVGQGSTFGTNMGNVANAILGGWQINGVFVRRSGLAQTISGAGYSTSSRYCRCTVRPNLKPGGDNNPVLGDLDRWFDPSQFEPVTPGYFGNVGRNTMDGPGLNKLNFSLFKGFTVGEAKNLQFRAEFFNLTNHPNFAAPSGGVFNTRGGINENLGRITRTVTTSRQIQLALKFEF